MGQECVMAECVRFLVALISPLSPHCKACFSLGLFSLERLEVVFFAAAPLTSHSDES